ncbi:MAG: heparan-alpha-glucosaminide N-acetyltransferase domain-containing protein [Ignavibacteriaceae bacterium]|jgi:predicted acyltransferase|nr:heparan-alpha-glucosaminide N-acetyltransferase domain-containing protein [Ignavibacteriaceae bacterium]
MNIIAGNNIKQRLASIDAFRGLTIAGMIIVLNPGSWKYVYPAFKHADWHGWTIADLVFPFFLFIVGVSITFSLSKIKIDNLEKKEVYLKIIKRSVILFLLGIFINSFPDFNFQQFRIMGVLQRIAICYLIVSILFLNTKYESQTIIAVSLLFIYWAIMEWVAVPGYPIGSYGKGENAANYLDRFILSGYMGYYEKLGEPEGFISTLPSLSLTLFGVLTGHFIKSKKEIKKSASMMFGIGVLLFLLGLVWDNWLPINKNLWTSSFTVLTGGLGLILFSIFYYLIDGLNYQKFAKPFVVLGMNAITVYVLSIVTAKIIKLLTFTSNGTLYHARSWAYENILLGIFGFNGASLAYAVLYCAIWCGIMWILYYKKIFIKV